MPRLGPHQIRALQRVLLTPGPQAYPPLADHQATDIWRGLRRKRLIEKDGPWFRLTPEGLAVARKLQEGEVADA